MLQRLKSFFATVDRDYHISVVKGLTDALDRAEKAGRKLQGELAQLSKAADERESVHAGVREIAHRDKLEVGRLRRALAESEATSEQRRIALEHEHKCRKESDENAKAHATRANNNGEARDALLVKVGDLEDALTKANLSLGLSRDRREEIGKSLDNLREATNDAMNFLYRNSSDGSEAAQVADNLADAMNN